MRKLIEIITSMFLIGLIICIFLYNDEIITYYIRKYNTYNMFETKNLYTKEKDYMLFQRTDNFKPKNKQELINVLYTILDDGMDTFTFYCEYDCNDDMKDISDTTLEIMNNYVHPYNSYDRFNVTINNYNIVTVSIFKNYSDEEIIATNTKLNSIYNEIINKYSDTYERIKAFHDYVINTTVYDKKASEQSERNIKVKSHKASNVLLHGLGICGGYTDTMSLFLDKLNINNFKVSTDTHIWNAVYIDDNWYNIDLTWDDPYHENGANSLIYDYFMINTDDLLAIGDNKHIFNRDYYLELE